ncbi:hypothetical protein N657DRAFT_584396 [Parathielavia appendiculata]|uniref:Carboxylesterase type B domain-containing protein n=1 Tax=Parathielavia appendiculata TaxID=2587402 RepID=A0AAN6YZ25_9PEZI|nr:hypothetical protein N657DRAFT_584396 [Parathielavia appendiculata]
MRCQTRDNVSIVCACLFPDFELTNPPRSNRSAYGLTTYAYLFSGNFSNITPRYWLGGMHGSDIPLVFGTHYQFRDNSTELEWETSYAIEAFWISFAANPSAEPRNHLGQAWPKYTAASHQIVVFGNATGLGASYVASGDCKQVQWSMLAI